MLIVVKGVEVLAAVTLVGDRPVGAGAEIQVRPEGSLQTHSPCFCLLYLFTFTQNTYLEGNRLEDQGYHSPGPSGHVNISKQDTCTTPDTPGSTLPAGPGDP